MVIFEPRATSGQNDKPHIGLVSFSLTLWQKPTNLCYICLGRMSWFDFLFDSISPEWTLNSVLTKYKCAISFLKSGAKHSNVDITIYIMFV